MLLLGADCACYMEDCYVNRNHRFVIACVGGEELLGMRHCELLLQERQQQGTRYGSATMNSSSSGELFAPCYQIDDSINGASGGDNQENGNGLPIPLPRQGGDNIFTWRCTTDPEDPAAVAELREYPWCNEKATGKTSVGAAATAGISSYSKQKSLLVSDSTSWQSSSDLELEEFAIVNGGAGASKKRVRVL